MLISRSDLTRILPQTYPFLMIDGVIEIKKGEILTAVKNITGNEWIFQNQMFQLAHMPEPLIIEAAAQAALVLYSVSDDTRGKGIKLLGKIKSELQIFPTIIDKVAKSVELVSLVKSFGIVASITPVDNRLLAKINLILEAMSHAK